MVTVDVDIFRGEKGVWEDGGVEFIGVKWSEGEGCIEEGVGE